MALIPVGTMSGEELKMRVDVEISAVRVSCMLDTLTHRRAVGMRSNS